MFPSEPAGSFTVFGRLPVELRLLIWQWASLHPRIVHLSKKRLAEPKDPAWWRRVRSDIPIEVPEDDESDYGSMDDDWIDPRDLERQIASQRLLTSDEYYRGNISRTDAKRFLHNPTYFRSPNPGWDCPRQLFGLRSESPVPGILLACQESFGVGSRVYTRAFGSLGAIPQTWFNFKRDTLYLDGEQRAITWNDIPAFSDAVVKLFAPDELLQLEKLAVRFVRPQDWFDYDQTDEESRWSSFFGTLQVSAPGIKQVTVVDGHYAHSDRAISQLTRSREQYLDLKFLKSSLDSSLCWRVDGFRIDASLLHGGIHAEKKRTEAILRRIRGRLDELNKTMPDVAFEVIVTSADEFRLLRDAYEFEKNNNKGCWFINPTDPTDCDYFVEDLIDEELESLVW